MKLWLASIVAASVALSAGAAAGQTMEYCSEQSQDFQRLTQERANTSTFVETMLGMVAAGNEVAPVVLRATPQQLDTFITGLNEQLAAARQAYSQAQGSDRGRYQTLIFYIQAMLDFCLDARARAEVGDTANANVARFREREAQTREMVSQQAQLISVLDERIAANRRQFDTMGCAQVLNPRRPTGGLAQVDINGAWQTNLGRMSFTQSGDVVRGTFPGGTIEGVVSGNVLRARWIQPGLGGPFRSSGACQTEFGGSLYWGTLSFSFEADPGAEAVMSLGGEAAQCYDQPALGAGLAVAGRRAVD